MPIFVDSPHHLQQGFSSNMQEEVEFYLSVFKNSRRLSELRNTGETHPAPRRHRHHRLRKPTASILLRSTAAPVYKFNEAVSFVNGCDTQQEVDDYWSKAHGRNQEIACGWLRDKFGLCWQIVPAHLPELIPNPKPCRP